MSHISSDGSRFFSERLRFDPALAPETHRHHDRAQALRRPASDGIRQIPESLRTVAMTPAFSSSFKRLESRVGDMRGHAAPQIVETRRCRRAIRARPAPSTACTEFPPPSRRDRTVRIRHVLPCHTPGKEVPCRGYASAMRSCQDWTCSTAAEPNAATSGDGGTVPELDWTARPSRYFAISANMIRRRNHEHHRTAVP